MRRFPACSYAIWMLVMAGTSICGAQTAAPAATRYRDPARFEKDIQAFEAQDAQQLPAPGAVLCVGSSTMRKWHGQIRQDLAPLTIVAHGFGGSTMFDLLHYTDRIVLPYKPRAIVVYEGDNDVAIGVGPEEIRDTFQRFVEKVHAALPEARIYFLAIKPSHSRRAMWPVMQQANKLIAQQCGQDRRLFYVDIVPALTDAAGQVRRELFEQDDLHLNRGGYEQLRAALRPILEKQELAYEQQRK